MPISHWGISVTHIPSATSFYLAALQPLGYRFIGHQGDSIGLGIDSADFFITQAPIGTRPAPNHIAFLAESRLIVRECYAAALNSGAYPSGSPKYRNEECECFNAAVEDLDGNTIEFIFRQPHGEGKCCGTVAPAEDQKVITWQKDVEEGVPEEDAQSVARSQASGGTLASQASKAKSRMQTAMDLVSNTSKSVKSDTPSQAISRTNTAPAKPDFPAKGLIGIALGAAAGAGLMYALHRAESRNAQEESEHMAYMSSKNSRRQSVAGTVRPPPPKAETVKESIAPPPPPPSPPSSKHDTRKFHRNFSTTESAYSRRPPPPETRAMRMIADTGYNKDDEDVQEVLSRYTTMRPHATRNRDDEIEYAPASRAPRSDAPSGHSIKRANTLPVGALEDRPNYYLEAPPAKSSASRYASRHGSTSGSHYDRRSSHDDANLKRHDSGVSMHSSHRSHRDRDRDSEAGRRSSASTIKPSRRDSKYDDVQAAVEAAVGKKAASKAPSSCYYPAAISLPPSKADSRSDRERDRDGDHSHAGSKAPTYISPRDAQIPPLEAVESKQSWEDFAGEESDGLGDVRTVMPDDSISCVDLSKRRRKHHSSRRGEAGSERTVRPARKEKERERGSRYSDAKLTAIPYRGKEREGKRSILGFA
ncbi:hypothetical protein CLAFUW4_12914 [Fulvia fulva]|uniref:VOC domain-containing protein n=1 Tax=Passalora fulva TaxID=5499 RepID=A0A9Q8PKE6_PASFU|nr:uncharacterized protein CLAFUR5_12780 [Fulvia fulva]KAK4612158.1 hypothetical protein CLAFUR4_12918 [Fulvia fulva]UJO24061.1 hypothetical protein CLAFUR5_12780 [Fulvia fulva]WPV21018.1 hypothetical protein CLAFUW4_12914 [Fulvia fulva]WPV35822.1 hypothetical protein CLAFUW7_12921 [Fulvia fulva]